MILKFKMILSFLMADLTRTRRFITKDLLMTDAYYELRAQEKVLLIYLIVFADDDGFND